MADRVTGNQTDNVVCRKSLPTMLPTPTTHCCGCPEDVFVVLRFSCPSLSPLVLLCFLVLLFCFACHIFGGARHLLVYSISFHFFSYFFFCFFVPFVFLFVNASGLLASVCRACRTQSDGTSFHCLLCLLRQYVVFVSWFCDHRACISLGGRIGTDTGCAGCRRVERTV